MKGVGTLGMWPVKRKKAKEEITYLAETRKITQQSLTIIHYIK